MHIIFVCTEFRTILLETIVSGNYVTR